MRQTGEKHRHMETRGGSVRGGGRKDKEAKICVHVCVQDGDVRERREGREH